MEPHTLVAVAALDTKNIGWIVGAIVLLFLGSGALVLVSRRTMEGRAQGQVSSSGDKTLEHVPIFVEIEVAVPRLSPAKW
jgi:hypothetical protein